MHDISYTLNDNIYLNITNRCTNACTFCIRYKARDFHGQYKLWLDHEPEADEVLKAIGDPNKYKHIVFCGYGEPLIRLEIIKNVCKEIRSQIPDPKSHTGILTQQPTPLVRIDTNGQANMFWGRNILPELKDLVDFMSISLNAETGDAYDSLCNSFFGANAHQAVIEFIKEAKKYIPQVEISVVDIPNVDIEKSKKLAESLGVKLRVRPYYEEKYVP